MRTPTVEELQRASRQYRDELPEPIAGVIDMDPVTTAFIADAENVWKRCGLSFEEFIKSCIVMGINLGIRIGENRRGAS